jgi:hypothetical protein
MSPTPASEVTRVFVENNARILNFAEKLSDEQLRWSPDRTLSIAFHLWHLARWTDCFQATVPGMTPALAERLEPGVQLWHASGLAQRWRFDGAGLGVSETGMELDHATAAALPFPPKPILLAYVRDVFAQTARTVAAIDDEQFQAPEQWQSMPEGIWGESTVGDSLLSHLTHNSRHLGMMECLLGLQTGSGSATDG